MSSYNISSTSLLTYDELEAEFNEAGFEMTVSEVHGIFSGYISSCAEPTEWSILKAFTGVDDRDVPLTVEFQELLLSIYHRTQFLLLEDPFQFEPLLPDDEEPLPTRARLLGDWAHGFLVGAGIAGLTTLTAEDDEIKEALLQYQELSQIDFMNIEDSEDEEKDFTELLEYTRMAAILIHQELVLKHIDRRAEDTIH